MAEYLDDSEIVGASDNDMMPNDGSYWQPAEPEQQAEERRVSLSKAQAAKPMLEELIALFEADIAALNTVESIPVDIETMPDDFLVAWKVRTEMLKYARDKKLYLESLLTTAAD